MSPLTLCTSTHNISLGYFEQQRRYNKSVSHSNNSYTEPQNHDNRKERSMRLFLAIDLPEVVKRELYYLALHLEHQAEKARVVPLENYHLTLLFIGETHRITEAREVFHHLRVPQEPLDLALCGIGNFRQRREYTWWVGVEENPLLTKLAETLLSLYRTAEFSLEKRSFKPHITLARGVKATRPLELAAPEYRFSADRISLMNSVSERGRMVYREIDSLKLQSL